MGHRASPPDPRVVADRLHSAAIHLLRRLRRSDPQTGVTAAQLSALSVLMGGPRTLGELAAAEQVRAPTMSRLVRELERSRLVARDGDPADARVVRVRSTLRGQRVLGRGRELRIAELERRLGALSKRELASVARAVAIIERIIREEAPTKPSR